MHHHFHAIGKIVCPYYPVLACGLRDLHIMWCCASYLTNKAHCVHVVW